MLNTEQFNDTVFIPQHLTLATDTGDREYRVLHSEKTGEAVLRGPL